MRKILLYICVLCAAMLCLSSCIKDRIKDYVFQYEVQASLADEEDWKALQAYFEESFVNEAKSHHFTSTFAEAYEKSADFYEQEIKSINQDLILDCIKTENDIVILNGVITGDKVREVIKTNYWNYEYKKYIRPDTE